MPGGRAVAAFACLAACALALPACGPANSKTGASSTSSSNAGPAKHVVVITDRATDGDRCGGMGDANWSALIGSRIESSSALVETRGEAGAGYAVPGATGRTLGDSASESVGPTTDIVVIAGGAKDTSDALKTDGAADSAFDIVHQQAPSATMVVVGPLAPTPKSGDQLPVVEIAVANAAERHGAQYMSALDWPQSSPGLFCSGSGDLTDAGHAELARRIGDAVTTLVASRK